MESVGKFKKVSYEEWRKTIRSMSDGITEEGILDLYDGIKLPQRATAGSAGYDLYSPIWIELAPGEDAVFPLGIRCKIDNGWFLGIFPRSGLGFKYYLRLANSIGVIDADYVNSDNEGHIMMKVRNESNDKTIAINRGDAIAQGIFLPFGITKDDNATGVRNGGFGSTGGAL